MGAPLDELFCVTFNSACIKSHSSMPQQLLHDAEHSCTVSGSDSGPLKWLEDGMRNTVTT